MPLFSAQITLLNELVSSADLHPDDEKLRRVILEMAVYAKYEPGHDRVDEAANAMLDWLCMVKFPTPEELQLKDAVLQFLRKPLQGEKGNDEQREAYRNSS